jgi:hypothetical protein
VLIVHPIIVEIGDGAGAVAEEPIRVRGRRCIAFERERPGAGVDSAVPGQLVPGELVGAGAILRISPA